MKNTSGKQYPETGPKYCGIKDFKTKISTELDLKGLRNHFSHFKGVCLHF